MRLLLLGLTLALSTCGQTPRMESATVAAPSDSLSAVVSQAAAEFFREAPQAVGLSLGVVSGGQIRTFHFGTTRPGESQRPSDETIYAIASITKTVTGSLLAQAAVDGRLDLGSDIRDYLADPYPNLEYEGAPILVGHLLSHVSGLPRSLPDEPTMRHDHESYQGQVLPWMAHVEDRLSDYSRDDFLRDLASVQLEAVPGTSFSYSNAAAQLAGHLLERAHGGLPFEQLVDSLIASPLGMRSTSLALSEQQQPHLAAGYDDTGRQMPIDYSAAGAAGGMMSTVTDLSEYIRWHLDESDPAVALSHSAEYGTLNHGQTGLGWYLSTSADGTRRLSCDGNIPGYSARVTLYPDLDVGIVLLANQLDWSIPGLLDGVGDRVLDHLDHRTFSY